MEKFIKIKDYDNEHLVKIDSLNQQGGQVDFDVLDISSYALKDILETPDLITVPGIVDKMSNITKPVIVKFKDCEKLVNFSSNTGNDFIAYIGTLGVWAGSNNIEEAIFSSSNRKIVIIRSTNEEMPIDDCVMIVPDMSNNTILTISCTVDNDSVSFENSTWSWGRKTYEEIHEMALTSPSANLESAYIPVAFVNSVDQNHTLSGKNYLQLYLPGGNPTICGSTTISGIPMAIHIALKDDGSIAVI